MLGKIVRATRERLGLTLREVSTRIGCSIGFLHNIEKTWDHAPTLAPVKTQARLEWARKLEAALSMPVGQLTCWVGVTPGLLDWLKQHPNVCDQLRVRMTLKGTVE